MSYMGVVEVLKSTVTLTDAQIKALPTTGVEIVPAPGAGKAIAPFLSIARIDNAAGVYTNIDADGWLEIGTTGASLGNLAVNETPDTFHLTGLLGSSYPTGSAVFLQAGMFQFLLQGWGIVGSVIDLAFIENLALNVRADNGASGDFTGGNAANTLRLTVLFMIVDV